MRHLSALIVLLFSAAINLYSQRGYMEGYIITNTHDTLYGLIENRNYYLNSLTCNFKASDDNGPEVYRPGDIMAYRFNDGKYYISKDFEGERYFFEYILNGILNIYLKQDENLKTHFYAEKTGIGMKELEYSTDIITGDDGIPREVKSNRHSIILSQYVADYPELIPSAMRMGSPTASNLVTFARQYHEAVCTDWSCIVYEKRRSPDIQLEMISGVAYVFPDDGAYIPGGTHFTTGIRVNISLPRASEFIYLGIGAGLYKYPEKTLLEKIPQSVTFWGDTIFLWIYETAFRQKLQIPVTIMYNNHRPGISPVIGLSVNLLRRFDFEAFAGLNYQINSFGIKLTGEYKVFPVDVYCHAAALKLGVTYRIKAERKT